MAFQVALHIQEVQGQEGEKTNQSRRTTQDQGRQGCEPASSSYSLYPDTSTGSLSPFGGRHTHKRRRRARVSNPTSSSTDASVISSTLSSSAKRPSQRASQAHRARKGLIRVSTGRSLLPNREQAFGDNLGGNQAALRLFRERQER